MTTQTYEPAVVLTFDQAREHLNVSRTVLFELVREDRIPSLKIGRSRRFLAEDLDAFVRGLRDTQAG